MRPEKLKVSRIELLVDVTPDSIKPTKVILPGSGGVVRVAMFGNKLCLYVEHDVMARKEQAHIYIYKDEQEFKFREGESYVGSFFKDTVGHHVYIGAPW